MKKNKKVVRIVSVTYITVSCCYILWRLLFTMNPDQMIPSIVFFLTDIITVFSSVSFAVTICWSTFQSKEPLFHENNKSVDVLIPTYNESLELVAKTMSACLNMDYPHNTYLLDDGNRALFYTECEKQGIKYISRLSNEGAKAGNLNNALKYAEGELLAVFDADFRPEKNFLVKLIGYFDDPKVAVVQIPQNYYNYNHDSFQHRLLFNRWIYSEQDIFMHDIMPSRDACGASYWIGTGAIIRREAIESIGGFATSSVTEDVLTSMLLHEKGWKTVYVDEPLACGMAPANISQYFTQRHRWAQGAFQIFSHNNPLFKKDLSGMRKICYMASLNHFMEGAFKMVYYLFPALYLSFGIAPVKFSPLTIVGMLAYFLIGVAMTKPLMKSNSFYLIDEVYSIIRSPIYLLATPALFFGRNVSFRVTPKNNQNDISLRYVAGPIAIFSINLVVLLSACLNPGYVLGKEALRWICAAWCLYTCTLASVACGFCFGRRKTALNDILSND